MFKTIFHLVFALVLTILTQLGGLAWLLSRLFKRKFLSFFLLYSCFSLAALWIAPLTGRVALSCLETGPLQVQSWLYCLTNRTYIKPEMRDVLVDSANAVAEEYPGTITLALDGGFPFFNGFPLLPHLSHDDGEKIDLAFYYQDEKGGYLPERTRSPFAYFAFEHGTSDCPSGPDKPFFTLRWDLAPVQRLWRSYQLDPDRTALLMRVLARDHRVGKILLEPHLVAALNLDHPKIRFQGCRAARHDDHIHLQL